MNTQNQKERIQTALGRVNQTPITQNIPEELQTDGLWCVWARDPEKGKVPINPRTGRGCDSGNPETFSDYQTAVESFRSGRYSGLGLGVFKTKINLVALDLDHVVDPETGTVDPSVQDILDLTSGTYMELSPSGTGFRILGTVSSGFQYNKDIYYIKNPRFPLEVYAAGVTHRFVTVTGNQISETRDILDISAAVAKIAGKYMTRPVIQKPERTQAAETPWIRGARNLMDKGLRVDTTLQRYWDGDFPGDDESANDLALAEKILYWAGDPETAVQYFLDSPYCQGKDGKHTRKINRPDYLQNTMAKGQNCITNYAWEKDQAYLERRNEMNNANKGPGQALAWEDVIQDDGWTQAATEHKHTESADPAPGKKEPRTRPQKGKADDLGLVSFSQIEFEPADFMFFPYIQYRKLNFIQGDPDTGKTAFACYLAARASRGEGIDGTPGAFDPVHVLIISVEDDDTELAGRLIVNGADLDRCHYLRNHREEGDQDGAVYANELTFDHDNVKRLVKRCNAKLVIFDPLQAFLGKKVDMNRANETRAVFSKLIAVAEECDCAVVIVQHQNKGQATKAMFRALGSIDIVGNGRSALMIGKNPDDEEQRVAIQYKHNNSGGGRNFAYRVTGVRVDPSKPGTSARVTWDGYSNLTAADLERAATRKSAGIPFEEEPLVNAVLHFISENKSGTFMSYSAFNNYCLRKIGFIPVDDNRQLKTKMMALAPEILKQHKVLVESADRRKQRSYCVDGEWIEPDVSYSVPGFVISNYRMTEDFQISLDSMDDGMDTQDHPVQDQTLDP